MKAFSILISIATLFFSGVRPFQQSNGFEQRKREAFQAFVDDLEAFAIWCGQKRLFLEQTKAFELILDREPDHADARRALGFRRDPAGAWIPSGEKKAQTNKNDAALKDARVRLQKAHEHLIEKLSVLVDEGNLSPAEIDELQEDVLEIDPENAWVREMRGEGEHFGPDTVAAARRREELAGLIQEAWDDPVDIAPLTLQPQEEVFGLNLQGVGTTQVRVLTTGEIEEARRLACAFEAAQEALRLVTGANVAYPRGFTAYLLIRPADKKAFLDKHPAVTPELRSWLAKLEGSGIPGTGDWAFWEADAEKRLDGMVRTAFDWLLREGFHVTLEQAWIHEGLGLYLTYLLVGTHLTWFVDDTGIDPKRAFDLRGRLRAPGLDWLKEAQKVFEPEQEFALEDILHRATGELGAEDLLRAHALTAFLLEARAEDFVSILTRLGAGEDPRTVLEEETGLPLPKLRQTLARWLVERERWIARDRESGDVVLLDSWNALVPERKRAVIADFRKRVADLDTLQLRLARTLVGRVKPAQFPVAAEPQFYDPNKHAPGDPIPRRRLPPDDPRVKEVLEQIPPADLRTTWQYDWAGGTVVRNGEPDDLEAVFASALKGRSPEVDLARAIALGKLDGGHQRKALAAFSHAYTDRDGNVYPTITLYDAWLSGTQIEMPDVDVLGVIHDVLGEWKRWVAPIPGTEHAALYSVTEDLFLDVRHYRQLRESLADCFLNARPEAQEGYEDLLQNFHAQWSLVDSQPDALGAVLPDADAWEIYIKALTKRCKDDPEVFRNGQKRLLELETSAQSVRSALVAALENAAARPR